MKTKKQKRSEAIERNEEYTKLSTSDKLRRLNEGGFRAAKQRLRLKEASNARKR